MKKPLPGYLVEVVTHPKNAAHVARELARETGVLGVREHGSGHRFVADRSVETVTVEVDGGEFSVDVKVARLSGEDGKVFDLSCEYDVPGRWWKRPESRPGYHAACGADR